MPRAKQAAVVRPVAASRRVVRAFNNEGARTALDGFGHGVEILGFNRGQFSCIDLLDALIEITGPCDLTIATWTAADADLRKVNAFLESGDIRSARWLVDYSFEKRQPDLCRVLRSLFSDAAIRTTHSHAKFALLKNDSYHVTVQTSMNLNENRRLENFTVTEDEALFSAYDALVAEVFETQKTGVGFGGQPSKHNREFERQWQSEMSEQWSQPRF